MTGICFSKDSRLIKLNHCSNMKHEFKKIVRVEVASPGQLNLTFDCGTRRKVDLTPVMVGTLFGALQEQEFFKKVEIDREVGTIFWPNGADFDPDTLFRWDEVVGKFSSHLQTR